MAEQAVMKGLSHLAAAERSVPHSWYTGHSSELGKGETWVHGPALASPLALIYYSYRHSGALFLCSKSLKRKEGGGKKPFSNNCKKREQGGGKHATDRQTNGVQLQNTDSSAGKGNCREGEALQKCPGAGLVWSQLSEQRGSPCGAHHQ